MKKNFIFIAVLIFSTAILACSNDDGKKSDPVEQAIDSSIITLPSCISASAGVSRSAGIPKSAGTAVNDVYDGIRENVGAIDKWTRTIRQLLKDIYHLTGLASSGDWSDNTPSTGDPVRVVWGPDTEKGYTTKVELYWSNYDVKGFEAYVTINKSEHTARGVITWDFHYIDDPDTANDDLVVQFIFDSTTEPKTLEIKATGLDKASHAKDPDNAWVKVTLDENHVFTLGGNYYFHNIDMMNNGNLEDRNYVFKVAGYDEKGMDADHINQAILNLAIPAASRSDIVNMFSEDSVASIFNEAVQSSWDAAAITDIKTWLGSNGYIGDLSAVSTGTDLTQDQLVDILQFAVSKTGVPSDISEILFILNLVNPAYYMENGFFGTWDGTRGTLSSAADIPASFGDLSGYTVDVVAPSEVKNLTVNYLSK